MSRARHESHVHVVAPSVAHAAERLAWAWGQERRQAWALDRQAGKSLADLHHERAQLARSIPPNRSAELADARRLLSLAEQDRRDLRRGTGRWAGTPAGHAAQAASGAALEYQRASEAVQDKSLGRWGRHKARREVREAGVRFDQALEAWRAVGEPYERPLESNYQRLEADVARLERAQQARDRVLGPGPLRSRTTGGAGPGRQGARKSRAPAPFAPCSPARAATLLPSEPRPRTRPGFGDGSLTWRPRLGPSTLLRQSQAGELDAIGRDPCQPAPPDWGAVQQCPGGAPPARQPANCRPPPSMGTGRTSPFWLRAA